MFLTAKTLRFHIISLIIIASSIVCSYWNLPRTFFQQDEWKAFAIHIYLLSNGSAGVLGSLLPVSPLSHFTPLAVVFSWLNDYFFKTDFTPYAWQSIALHILNAVLLYSFVFAWFKSKKIAFISSLFFAVNSIPHQAVTWVANTYSYEVPVAFILLSLLLFLRFSTQIFLSLFMLLISLLFHEVGIFLFLFYPVLLWLTQRQVEWKKSLRIIAYPLLLSVAFFVLIRTPLFFLSVNPVPEITDISRPPTSVYPYRLFTLGIKSFAGSFIPEKTLIGISDDIVKLAYPQFVAADRAPNPVISQSIVLDLVSYAISFVIVSLIFFFIRFIKEKKITEGIVWSLLFIPLSFFPYAFVLGKAGYASIQDSKFFYVPSIGVSVLLGLIAFSLTQRFSAKKTFVIAVYILFGFYLIFHIHATRTYLDTLQSLSTQRKAFLTTIVSSYPRLPQRVVVFTQSDTAYYGMPDTEKILPVQVGFGGMLMIWYQKEENFPGCMYEGQFLLRLLEEGYRYCGGRGFGYARSIESLERIITENHLPVETVIAYSWSGKTQIFYDITAQTRDRISKEIK